MKAAFITRTGPPDVLEYGDLPQPQPGEGELLVRIKASAVNPIDTYIRSGAVAMPLTFPFIPGCDFAGEVVACGPGVKRFAVGDRVWGSNQGLLGRQGTLAEFASIHEQWAYPIPTGESDDEAAAGALTGITAHLGLFARARLRRGETVFVNGGTGGVGSAVVQLAKAAGAKVIATVGSQAKQQACRQRGADHALLHSSPSLDEEIRAAAPEGIHVWYETQREPTFDRTVALMAPEGRIVLMAGRQARPEFPVGPFYVKGLSMTGFAMFNASPAAQREAADALNAYYAAGAWRPLVGTTFRLDQAAQAHALQEANTLQKQGTLTGKIVVRIG
jgi:NADPH2:quinone reductase